MVSGALGVGGGFVLVPMLVYLFKQDMHTAIGTSLVIIVPTALAGALVHVHAGNINAKDAWIIAVFAIAGGCFGAYIASYISASVLRKIFAVLLVVIAVKMFIK